MYNYFLLVISQIFSSNSARVIIDGLEYTFSYDSQSKNWTVKSKICFAEQGSLSYAMKEVKRVNQLKLEGVDTYLEVKDSQDSIYLVQHAKNLAKFVVFKRFMENSLKIRSFWMHILAA